MAILGKQTGARVGHSRYTLLRPAFDAAVAFCFFLVVSLALSSDPSSASPYQYNLPVTDEGARAVVEIAFASNPAEAVYKRTDANTAWILLLLAFSFWTAFNLVVFRHLRQAYTNPRRMPKS